jgi:hypothetical protein
MHAHSVLAATLVMAVSGCDRAPGPTSPNDEAAETAAIPSADHGGFLCGKGAPGNNLVLTASADVPPGGTKQIIFKTPPDPPAGWAPDKAIIRCKVDLKYCDGSSCRGEPPVDFFGTRADGLTWSSLSEGDQVQSATYTAEARNNDPSASHHVTLVFELHGNWGMKPQ